MGIVIMIVGEPVDIIRRRRMIQKKAALVEIVTDHRYVPFRSINEHLKGKNWMLGNKDEYPPEQ